MRIDIATASADEILAVAANTPWLLRNLSQADEILDRVVGLNEELQALPEDRRLLASEQRRSDRLADEIEKLSRAHELVVDEIREQREARSNARQLHNERLTMDNDTTDRGGLPATARGSLQQEATYRIGGGGASYFRDLVTVAQPGNFGPAAVEAAGERLRRNQREALDKLGLEYRDVVSTDPGTGSFIPPLYMGEQWIDKEVAGRPLADAVAKMPLSPTGKQMDFPRVQTAPAAAVQASEAAAVSEVDFDSETYSVTKVLIAGQNDLSIQAYEFADPGMDVVIMRELTKSYNSVLDSQLLAGSGSSGQHRGLRNVSGINTVSFASGNGAALLGKIYDAISQVATSAPGYVPNAVVMHPRRAAWIASHRDTSGSLLQQGAFAFAVGEQDAGFAYSLAGLGVVIDPNIATNLGTNTNEDELYVTAVDELILAEGEMRARVLSEVLSGNMQIRLQLYAFSAFAGGRRPKVITRISGAGLTPPTFPST
jgi:HK97 family phage major capsid protein